MGATAARSAFESVGRAISASRAELLCALMLLLIKPVAPPVFEQPSEDPTIRGHETFARFWSDNKQRFEAISFWSRVPVILLTLAGGALIFIFARRLFGARAALFAVLLFSLEPTVLAHGRVVQTDMAAALFYLLFFFTLYNFVRRPGSRRALWLGCAAGLALVVKFSLIIIAPVLVIVAL